MVQPKRSFIPSVALLLGALTPVLQAQTPFHEDQRFVVSDGSLSSVAKSVALEGGTALVGATGKAFLFRWDSQGSWSETQALTHTGAGECSFGRFVHLHQGKAVVTDLSYPGPFCDRIGLLYAYDDNGVALDLVEKFSGPNLEPPFSWGSPYGFTVDLEMDDDWMLVGADGYSPDLVDKLPVAVFLQRVDGQWQALHAVTGSDTVLYSGFGQAVSVDAASGMAVVGDPDAEAVYIFAYDGATWSEIQRLKASDGTPGDRFGEAVAMEGGLLAVSSPWDDGQFTNQGSVYVYRFDGSSWVETQNFASSLLTAGANFGTSLDLESGRLAVGAQGLSSAFVYRDFGNAFLLVQQLAPSVVSGLNSFGAAVALDGTRCLVGEPSAGFSPGNQGSAFLYELHDLALTTSTAQVQAGQPLTIVTRGGIPGTPCQVTFGLGARGNGGLAGGLFGVPGALQGVFNAEGRCVLIVHPPQGMAGKTLKLRTYGLVPPGVAEASNPIAVAVL